MRILVALLLLATLPVTAHAWEPFRSRNSNVEVGNARMAANDPNGALQAYDRAARQLPEEASVQLNRGIAQMGSGDLPGARETLLAATDPNAPATVRADAYYDLGLAFFQEADAAAGLENHGEAQRSFREAADAFRRSLRLRPGDRNTAWNLELALRRMREEEQREQEQQEQQEQDQQQQDQQQQDQQQQDQQDQQGQDQDQDQQGQDQQDQDQQGQDQQDQQDQQGQDQQDQQQGQDQQDQQGQDQDQQGQDQQDQQDQQGQDQGDEDRQQGEDQQDQNQGSESQGNNEPLGEDAQGGQQLPGHVERVLDALQNDEQNLERARARQRAARERRRVLRDW
ncbi:MAG: hypothetical protein AAGE52_15305 [Myxococcota bacterium]